MAFMGSMVAGVVLVILIIGFHIYSFEKLSCDDFCYEEEYDAIFDYYYNKADYEI